MLQQDNSFLSQILTFLQGKWDEMHLSCLFDHCSVIFSPLWSRINENREEQKGEKQDMSQPALLEHSPLPQIPPPITVIILTMAVTSDLPMRHFRKP